MQILKILNRFEWKGVTNNSVTNKHGPKTLVTISESFRFRNIQNETFPKTLKYFRNYSLEFIQSFIAVDHNTQDNQILLDKSVLKNFKINICNDVDF